MTLFSLITAIAAEILSFNANFDMTGPAAATYTVSETVLVRNAAGEDAATLVLYTDSFRTISSFSGTVVGPSGVEKKVRRSDLITFAPFDELGTDTYIHTFRPSSPYPYTVKYEYTISYGKGFMSFPPFFPVVTKETALRDASYCLSVPSGTEIQFSSSCPDPSVDHGKKDIYTWELKDWDGIADEDFLPKMSHLLPHVYAAPKAFRYGKFKGAQENWNSLGESFSELVSSADGLPPTAVAAAVEMTAGCGSDIEKLKVLYSFLRKKTRYVSIQMGLGGYRPFKAEEVDRTGFGDCKALANYMKNLLQAVGIRSNYVILNTDERELGDNVPSVSMTDHAMLAVPMEKDTVWVECTNPSFPLGFRHEGIAGHQVLLLDGENSHIARAASYTGDSNRTARHMDIHISQDGSATMACRLKNRGLYVEPFVGFMDLNPVDRDKALSTLFRFQVDKPSSIGCSDNFDGYDGAADYVPETEISFTTACSSLCKTRGSYLTVSAMPLKISFRRLPEERQNDIFIKNDCVIDDVAVISMEGVDLSGIKLPEAIVAECSIGHFEASYSLEGTSIKYECTLSLIGGMHPKSEYESFRAFMDSVVQSYASTLILKNNQ